jgi:hypothetical protein
MSAIFAIFWLTCCAPVMGILGFWVGRCARRLPVIDNNLPWAMRHFQRPQPAADNAQRPPPASPCCHHDCACRG